MSTKYIRTADKLRAAVLALDHNTCVYCGNPGDCIDHLIPEARYGPDVIDNLLTCCRSCNSRKGDRPLHETDMRLQHGRFQYVAPISVAAHASSDHFALFSSYVEKSWSGQMPSEDEEIAFFSLLVRPGGGYRIAAEKIVKLIGGDRNAVLAKVSAFRSAQTQPLDADRRPVMN